MGARPSLKSGKSPIFFSSSRTNRRKATIGGALYLKPKKRWRQPSSRRYSQLTTRGAVLIATSPTDDTEEAALPYAGAEGIDPLVWARFERRSDGIHG